MTNGAVREPIRRETSAIASCYQRIGEDAADCEDCML
jgi:hypothetical protein